MSKVSSLTVAGYKSIRVLKDFELRGLNVLIGANGAGKSNFLGFFRLLNELVTPNWPIYVQTQGAPDALLHFGRKVSERLRGEFSFGESSYGFTLIPTNDNRLVFQQEVFGQGSNPNPDDPQNVVGFGHDRSLLAKWDNELLVPVREAIASLRTYHFHDAGDSAKVKQKHATSDNLRLKTDAANLAAYLRMLSLQHASAYRRIVDTIRLVAPFFGDFVMRDGDPEFVELEWTQAGHPDTPFRAHVLSDGSLRFICLATLLLQPAELLPDTVLIDEPELGLHPYAISVLADMFKQVAEDRQLIISTQSVELVNQLSPEDVIVVDQVDGESSFNRLDQDSLSGWLEEYALGELWKRNVVGGRP